MKQRILLTGGTGYIGSHTFVALHQAGYDITILDNFSNSKPTVLQSLKDITGLTDVDYIEGDILDAALLAEIFATRRIHAVIHFAAKKAVGESMDKPLAYHRANIGGLITLLEEMERADIRKLVFSSSATVYGITETYPTDETAPLKHINPYGFTKITSENILHQLADSNPDWSFGILRYFNPVGAHSSGLIGDDPTFVPQNLMPYIEQVAIGKLAKLSVFGDDYDTPDGTGIRDYIHVMDLAEGHVASLDHLMKTNKGHVVNIGTGIGLSVLDIVKAYEKETGRKIPYEIAPRRLGDVPVYLADVKKAKTLLGFSSKRSLADICKSSFKWISNQTDLT